MSEETFYNFSTVLSAASSRIEEIVRFLLPNARSQIGCIRVGGIDNARGDSLSISTKPHNAGVFTDHADPSIKGNIITLWALVKGCDYKTAGNALAGFLNIQPEARMHLPKKRPVPKINNSGAREFTCAGKTQTYQPLSAKAINYAGTRGITEETLRRAKCASTDTHIIFPHFDEDNKVVLLKAWSCDGRKHIFTNDDPVPVLFGKHMTNPITSGGNLIITEGHWDALTWSQLGYHAVSIPSGASNDEWIGEDYSFLNCFERIFLDFDDDPVGREAESRVRTRLGYERCRLLRYRFKDANAALMANAEDVLHAAFKHALEAPIDRIINPSEKRERVRERLCSNRIRSGIPFFLPSMPVLFKPNEIVLWYGTTKHGKSTILSNQIAYSASQGNLALVSSFEQDTSMTIGSMLVQYTADKDIASSSCFDEAYNDLTSKVFFFDAMERSNPDQVIATMVMAHKQLGVKEFVVDNAMTLDVDRQDNTAQANVADKFRVFAAQYPVVLHLVMHPRKPPSQEAGKPPSLSDIMGAMEWSAMAHKIICVWRDVAKAQRMSEMIDEGTDPLEREAFNRMTPDGKIFVRGDRETGDLPMTAYWFDRDTKRAWKNPEDMLPYWKHEAEALPEE